MERAVEAAEHARAALEAQGEPVLARERAASRIETGFSRRFTPAPDALVARLSGVTESVLEHVAFGRTGPALDLGAPLLDEIEQHVVALGRGEDARDVANLCLFLVRAELAERRSDAASMRVDRCLRLVSGLDPDERLHLGLNLSSDLSSSVVRFGGTWAEDSGSSEPILLGYSRDGAAARWLLQLFGPLAEEVHAASGVGDAEIAVSGFFETTIRLAPTVTLSGATGQHGFVGVYRVR